VLSEWVLAVEGTEAGQRAALMLALLAAFLHALFGALQKGKHDPWTSRTAIDTALIVLAGPVALFVVPWPEPDHWWIYAGMVAIHFAYKVAQAMTYERGAYTVVYPVVRGTGPVFTVIGAGLIFDETFGAVQWIGVTFLVAGLFGLSAYNVARLTVARDTLRPALAWAVVTGGLVAAYTTWDAYGIRATPDPMTFLAWFFFLTAFDFPVIAALRGRWRRPSTDLVRLGLMGALVAFGSFGSVMLATRLDDVGEAAVLRETSVVFAALIGWLLLGEKVGPRRFALMALIALGAVVVEVGG
jgi:drug/metabolite transporter (DMT)-like permease